MNRLTFAAFGALLTVLVSTGFGCELITSPDRTKIPAETTGTGGTGASSTGGGGTGASSTGGGGTGGMAGAGGMMTGGGGTGGMMTTGGTGGMMTTGGTGGMMMTGGGGAGGMMTTGGTGGTGGSTMTGMPCLTAADCPDPANECQDKTCDMGVCGTAPKMDGTLTATQKTGDCKVKKCMGGDPVDLIDDTDTPNDGNDCTQDVCTNGLPSNPFVTAGGACASGGSVCDGAGKCVACVQPSDCPGVDTECKPRSCDNFQCGFMNVAKGGPVANQTMGDCLKNQCDGNGGVETVSDDSDVPNDGNDCTTDSCNMGTKVFNNAPLNTACGMNGALHCDGNGACVGCNDPGQCGTPANPCLVAACNSGMCGTANKQDGTACNDNNACTQSDSCQGGSCTGSNPIVCSAQDQCHVAGTCNPADGTCSNPNKQNGSACNDNNGCTQADTCQNGACSGGNAVVCSAQDQCHVAGTCNPANGQCSNPPKADGSACNDGSLCTQTDTCQTGVCTGASPVVCSAQDQCHVAGTCNPANGQCSNPPKADGSACNDNSACTATDTCQTGVCTGGSPVVCSAQDQCHVAGTCNPADGTCSNPPKQNGQACNDGNGCTQTDTCQNGSCTGSNPVTCSPLDQCHVAGTCDMATGMCTTPNAMDGTSCMTGGSPGACTNGTCNAFVCNDGMKNGSETDTDCGGGSCPLCANTKACLQNSDCQSGHCVGLICVECVAPADCPGGPDTDCHMRTCNANTCGINNPASGTVTGTQATGDCKENQCDGSGNIVQVNKDTDVPVDNKDCTSDVCTAGVPSNPNVQAGTACNQNGGNVCDGNGNCVVAPTVVSTTPADGAGNLITPLTVSVTFSTAMNPATLTGQTVAGACSGSIQVSADGFNKCVPFAAAAATMSVANTVATLTPSPALDVGKVYQIKVTTAAAAASGATLAATFLSPTGFGTAAIPATCTGSVVISQVYGAGGNSGASYKNDFVVLFNGGATAVDLSTWAVHYASTAGTSWTKTNLSGSIPAGGYFLIKQSGGANGLDLPTADVTGATSMAAGAGKVILTNTQTALSAVACPSSAAIVDVVGYGVGTNCSEGGGPTPTISATTAAVRKGYGCTDANDNSTDFVAGLVNPRNSQNRIPANESGFSAEIDYCLLQFPASFSVQTGTVSNTIYGRVYEAGFTEAAGANAAISAQVGYGPTNLNPEVQGGWTWVDATFNQQYGNNDEYQATFTAPLAGSYSYAVRFNVNGGAFTYCDLDASASGGDSGAGSNPGFVFDTSHLGAMTVTP